MQDSNITYKVTATGIEEATAKFNALGATIQRLTVNKNGSVTASGKSAGAMNEEAKAASNNAGAVNRASKAHESYFAHIAKTTIQSALVNKAFLGLTQAAGDAVKQVDLFNNFPATMQAMGVSAKDSSAAFQTLKGYVAQVGGNLSQAAISVTRFTEVTRNVKASTAEFVGVNNALIAGGAGAEVQKNALEQLTQAYSRGKPQLIEWRSLMVAMPLQLSLVAKAMNLPNANALGESLTKGKVSMQDFITELTKLGTGTGPIAQQAIARMQGIEFATNIMKNALTNGLAAIYQAVGRNNIIAFFNFLTQVIITLSGWVVVLINNMISLFNWISSVFGGPQISHFTGEAQGAAGALGDGASNAGDMADGLGDAADNAKKINKSLAAFDKMNVLPDKTSGKTKDSGSDTTGPVDPATAAALTGIFDNINGKIMAVGTAAKVFAGILAGLVAIKFGQAIIDQFNGVAKSIGDTHKNLTSFKDTLTGGKEGDNIFVKAKGGISALGVSIGALVGSMGKALLNPWVLLAVAIAALVAGIIYLYNTNKDFKKGFDEIWGLVGVTLNYIGDIITGLADGAVKYLVNAFNGLPGPVKAVFDEIGKALAPIGKFFEDMAKKIGLTGPPMEQLGIAVGAVAIALVILTTAFTLAKVAIGLFNGVMTFGGWILAAADTALAWTINLGFIIAKFVATAAAAVVNAASTAATWVAGAATSLAAWVAKMAGIVAEFVATKLSAATQAATTAASWVAGAAESAAAWVANVAKIVATFVVTKVASVGNAALAAAAWVAGAVATAAAWVIANAAIIGIIGLIILLVVGAVYLIIKHWDDIKNAFIAVWGAIKVVWGVVVQFFQGVWNGIVGVFSAVGSWFGSIFSGAWEGIKRAFSAVGSFFGGVWDTIKNIFTNIGSNIGNAVGNAFKTAINGVLWFLETQIRGIVNIINGAIGVIDAITPGTLPRLPQVTLPRLAKGGVVNQATMAIVGESGREAVMPLDNNTEWIDELASKLNASGNGQPISLTVQIGEDKIATKVIELINEKTQMSGRNAIIV